MSGLRDLPSIDHLLGTAQGESLVSDYGAFAYRKCCPGNSG